MLKLGRNPSPFGAVQFRFAQIFNPAALPTPPAQAFGHKLFQRWGMLANDKVGDCVVAGACHETMIWTREHNEKCAPFSDATAIAAYSAIGGYVPGDDSTDNGLDMAMAASYRRKTGIADTKGVAHKIDAYLQMDPKNVDVLMQATYVFGAIGIGVNLPKSAEGQFDSHQPWTVVRNSQILGGHYVSLVGRNSHGMPLVVTWGRLQACEPNWIRTYCDEAIAYLSLENLDAKGLSPEGYDRPRLLAMLNSLPRR